MQHWSLVELTVQNATLAWTLAFTIHHSLTCIPFTRGGGRVRNSHNTLDNNSYNTSQDGSGGSSSSTAGVAGSVGVEVVGLAQLHPNLSGHQELPFMRLLATSSLGRSMLRPLLRSERSYGNTGMQNFMMAVTSISVLTSALVCICNAKSATGLCCWLQLRMVVVEAARSWLQGGWCVVQMLLPPLLVLLLLRHAL
jgi:hypothetical protein